MATTGTFTAVDQTHEFLVSGSTNLALSFGEGTVKLQRKVGAFDTWIDIAGGEWTEDAADIIYSGSRETRFRLNCTAYTSTITWEVG